MSAEPVVPEWTLGWRLRRALDFAGVSVVEMADELGVGRTTVSGWLNDPDRRPRRIYLRYWADRCRVPLDWLEYGELPRVDSNHQPAGWRLDHPGAGQTGAKVVEVVCEEYGDISIPLSKAEIHAFRYALKAATPSPDRPNGGAQIGQPVGPSADGRAVSL